MRTLRNYRRFIINIMGIVPLILSLGNVRPAFAATANSDISVTIEADRSQVQMGQSITYTVTMANLGPDDASFVDVGFSLPDQLNLTSMTCDLGISPDTPFCEYSSLPAGQTVVSTLVASPTPGSLTHDRKLIVTANVFFEVDCSFDPNCTLDSNSNNNSASLITKLTGKLAHP